LCERIALPCLRCCIRDLVRSLSCRFLNFIVSEYVMAVLDVAANDTEFPFRSDWTHFLSRPRPAIIRCAGAASQTCTDGTESQELGKARQGQQFMAGMHDPRTVGTSMFRGWSGVPPSGGWKRLDRLKPGLQAVRGSWSQCMPKSERGLSLNRTPSSHPSPPVGEEVPEGG